MNETPVAIVGAGLSGLYAAYLLEQQGVHGCVVLEARQRPGGRLLSASAGEDRFDLGATWYWPAMQPEVDAVVRALGLRVFPQHEAGMLLVEQTATAPAHRHQGLHAGSPPALRIAGGMAALGERLAARLSHTAVRTGQRVLRVAQSQAGTAVVEAVGTDGVVCELRARHVLLAVPPRLAIASIAFQPALPARLAHDWAACPTWMAPHAKYLAVYPRPFWRRQGLSGSAQSRCGPMVEMHDASPIQGRGALFGFIGLPAATRRQLAPEVLLPLCRAQMGRLFGPEALAPLAEWLQDWSEDGFTATAADAEHGGGHATAPAATPGDGGWAGRITGIASEWSPRHPGYVAGALEAAARGVAALLGRFPTTDTTGA